MSAVYALFAIKGNIRGRPAILGQIRKDRYMGTMISQIKKSKETVENQKILRSEHGSDV